MKEAGTQEALRKEIGSRRAAMLELLQSSLRCRSVSGAEKEFVQMLADWGSGQGFTVDQWVADESQLIERYGPISRHLPLSNRPTLHIGLKGASEKRTLLFNGHTDVVGVSNPDQWKHDPWSGTIEGSIVYGHGACDVKGPIVAALWAMQVLQQIPTEQRGDIAIELVPGEEDCVGLGTLTSIARGYDADGIVVLEPTDGLPCCALRGGCRFEITATGRAVHGTVKWLGADAITIMQNVLAALKNIEQRWNDRSADVLFNRYPIARPITIDRIEGGGWQGMICDRCLCAGYLELLPSDNLGECKAKLQAELAQELRHLGENSALVRINFGEEYLGHRTSPENPFCRVAERWVMDQTDPASRRWHGFNSGCEAGMRANLLGTPTIVWGPGSLKHAHAADEQIDFVDIQLAAQHFAEFALAWTNVNNIRPQSNAPC